MLLYRASAQSSGQGGNDVATCRMGAIARALPSPSSPLGCVSPLSVVGTKVYSDVGVIRCDVSSVCSLPVHARCAQGSSGHRARAARPGGVRLPKETTPSLPRTMFASLLSVLSLAGGWHIVDPSGYTRVASIGNSTLYHINTSTVEYVSGAVALLDLHGTRNEQGFAFGNLLASESKANYDALIGALKLNKIEKAAVELIVDWQWASALSKQVPARFADELAGFADGCSQALPSEARWCSKAAGRLQVLANLPGDVKDIVFVLLDELDPTVARQAAAVLRGGEVDKDESVVDASDAGTELRSFLERLPWQLAQCSMWAAWGNRTAAGDLFSGRNLDWNHNTGCATRRLNRGSAGPTHPNDLSTRRAPTPPYAQHR